MDKDLVSRVGYEVLDHIHRAMRLPLTSLVATVLLQHPDGLSSGKLQENRLAFGDNEMNLLFMLNWC